MPLPLPPNGCRNIQRSIQASAAPRASLHCSAALAACCCCQRAGPGLRRPDAPRSRANQTTRNGGHPGQKPSVAPFTLALFLGLALRLAPPAADSLLLERAANSHPPPKPRHQPGANGPPGTTNNLQRAEAPTAIVKRRDVHRHINNTVPPALHPRRPRQLHFEPPGKKELDG